MNKKSLFFKISISVLLILYLVYWASLDSIVDVVSKINGYLLLLTIPLVLLLYVIRSFKWGLLLDSVGVKRSKVRLFKIIFMGLFYSLFTPAKAGELSRVYYLKESKARTLPTVIWDKIIDGWALVFLSLVAVVLFFWHEYIFYAVIGMVVFLSFMIFLLRNKKTVFFFTSVFKVDDEDKKEYIENMLKIERNVKSLIGAFSLGILYYFVCFLIAGIVLYAISPGLNMLIVFSLPIIILFGNIPITISGIGSREFVTVLVFKMVGEGVSYGFSFSILLFLIITVIPALLGYMVILLTHEKAVKFKNIPGNYYNKHKAKNIFVRLLVEKFYYDFNSFLRKIRVKKVLDVGCGEGYVTKKIKDDVGVDIIGVDIDKGIIAKANKMHKGIKFKVDDVYDLSFKDNSFECVVASEMLEHLLEPEKAVKEIKRVSKKYCVFSVPNEPYWRIANMVRFAYLSRLGNTPGHVQNFTTRQFFRMLRKNFKDVKLKHSTVWNIALCKK